VTRARQVAAIAGICAVVLYVSSDHWFVAIGRALICDESANGGTIVIDNLNYEYWSFRESADLQRRGLASTVLVTAIANQEGEVATAAMEVTNAFARVARLSQWEIIPIREKEPISLNAAYQVRDFLLRRHITSVTLVSPALRSRRSDLIYRSVLGERGVATSCVPVPGTTTPDNWTRTWHGIQDVSLQFLKLQYYRLWMMPKAHRADSAILPLSVQYSADSFRVSDLDLAGVAGHDQMFPW
jgi:hypothetical protein